MSTRLCCVSTHCTGPTDVLGVSDATGSIGSSISSGVTGGVTSVMALFGAKGGGRSGPPVRLTLGCTSCEVRSGFPSVPVQICMQLQAHPCMCCQPVMPSCLCCC